MRGRWGQRPLATERMEQNPTHGINPGVGGDGREALYQSSRLDGEGGS